MQIKNIWMMNQVMFQLATKKQILKKKGKLFCLKICLQNNLRKKSTKSKKSKKPKKSIKPKKLYSHGMHLLRMISSSSGQNKMKTYSAGLLTCVSWAKTINIITRKNVNKSHWLLLKLACHLEKVQNSLKLYNLYKHLLLSFLLLQ